MTFRRAAVPALLGTLLLASLSAFSQATTEATPVHDPRIPQIIHSLEKSRSIHETELSPDGKLIAWNVSGDGIELAPLNDTAHPRHITACASGVKGSESGLA